MDNAKESQAMATNDKTISQVFDEFLADQKASLSADTSAEHQTIIDIFEGYLESFCPGTSQEEKEQIMNSGDEFCKTFGPEKILSSYTGFFGSYLPRDAACEKETMRAAGRVMKQLANWMAEKEIVEDTTNAQERAIDAANDLIATQDALELLEDFVSMNPPEDFEDEIADHFSITKIEPGKLWLEATSVDEEAVGPVRVPEEATQICQLMWDIEGVVVKSDEGWQFLEVWNVKP